jgi:hypothetical protein
MLECKERERNDESAGPRLIPTRASRETQESRPGSGIWWGNALAGRSSGGVFRHNADAAHRLGASWSRARAHGHTLTSTDRAEFDLVRNAMFTLLGLMVGFAISMAVSRYDLRKSYEEAQANAIGTEYLRLDLMPPATTTAARALLRTYVDERIAFYRDRDPNREEKTDAATMET